MINEKITNKIISISHRFGDDIDTKDVEKDLSLENGFIERKTGIKKLHAFKTSEDFLDSCIDSVKEVCEKSHLNLSDLKGIYAAGNMTNFICPTLSTQLAKGLGLENVISDSVGLGCTGGVQALKLAHNQLIVDSIQGKKSFYVVVAADHISAMTNKNDYKTRVLFSDAVSVLLVTNDNLPGIFIDKIETRTLAGEDLYSLQVKSPNNIEFKGSFWEMEGRKVFNFGVNSFGRVLDLLNIDLDEIDYIIPHQANLRMLEEIEKRYNILQGKLYKQGVINHGNTSSSTVFIGLKDIMESQDFNKLVLVAFGADLSYGGVLLSK